MIDRYTRDALARYGRLRQLDPAAARAELEQFDQLLGIERPRAIGHPQKPAASVGSAGSLRYRRVARLLPSR